MKHRHTIRTLICLGLVLILSVGLLASCGKEEATPPAEKNAVTDVTLAGSSITVKAVLTPTFLSEYEGKEISLFALPSHHNDADGLDGYTPVASSAPAEEMTFTFPATAGVETYIYSSFLIASRDERSGLYTPLSSAVYLSNPEVMAPAREPSPVANTSIKGLISDDPAAAIGLGVSYTVVDVYIDRLLLGGWNEGAYAYVAHGVTEYLDGDELAALDKTVATYTDAHVQVFLRFRLGDTIAIRDGIYVPGSTPLLLGYAVNMSDSGTARIMEGFLGFMADRYASPEGDTTPIAGFIVGYRANNPAEYAEAGAMTLSEQITNYEKLVHVAYIALKSHNSDARVYISLDDRHALSDENPSGWDVPTFLVKFRDEAAMRGDYDWHVAAELHAEDNRVWEEDTAADRDFYTVRNLSTLTDLIAGEPYRTSDGAIRRLLISGMSIPCGFLGLVNEDDLESQAISYLYTYMTAVQNGRVEALIYDTYIDTPTSSDNAGYLYGLRPNPLLASLSGSADRPIRSIFAAAGTGRQSDSDKLMSSVIGAPYNKLSAALAGQAPPVTSLSGATSVSGYVADHKGAATILSFTNGRTDSIRGAGSLTYAELVNTSALDTVTLHARFDRLYDNTAMAVTFDLPASSLTSAEALLLDLYAGGAGSYTGNSDLTLRITRPAVSKAATAADGGGAVVYEGTLYGVSGSAWQTASFNLESLSALIGEDGPITPGESLTATLYLDGGDAISYDLGLAGVHVLGAEKEKKSNPPSAVIVTVVVVILVLAVGGTVAFLYIRKSRKQRS